MPLFDWPEFTLDGLPRRAAARHPDRTALVIGQDVLTFAELDARADRFAALLEDLLEQRGARVGLANVLTPGFAAAYYGTVRSGSIAVLVNPLAGQAALRHVFSAGRIEVAVVPSATAEVLMKMRDFLPQLRTVLVTDAEDGIVPGEAVPLGAALAGVAPRAAGGSAGALVTDVACVQFTTGTTGRPKGVLLTHRNLVANAAQTARAHELDEASVTLNHLPLYHVMHLNSAVYAGATQVLCTEEDPVASLAAAAIAGATHYYGLPARLHRLAADERLDGPLPGVPAGPRLRAVLCGGSALAPAAGHRLDARLGIPVLQGYGLAEMSPLSHCQRLGDEHRRGCVGVPLPATECQVVRLESREVAEVYAAGEIQLRGPQLMAGYLDDDEPSPIDGDGWLSTGDVGYLDEDGVLFVVDRVGDVFKHDNDLVSPTSVEHVLAEDPRVADCVVAPWPDPVHGHVVWAGIVLCPDAAGLTGAPHSTEQVLASVVDNANARLAPFERIHRAEAVKTVPRTKVGKPARRELRNELRNRAAA